MMVGEGRRRRRDEKGDTGDAVVDKEGSKNRMTPPTWYFGF